MAEGLTPQQKRFCHYLADGLPQGKAYLKAYKGVKKVETASVCANKLLKNTNIREYYETLVKKSESEACLSRKEKREFLARVVRTPINKVANDSDLVQERVRTMQPNGAKKETLKMPDKLKAIEQDNKMAGHNEPEEIRVEHSGHMTITPFQFTRSKAKERLKQLEAEQAESDGDSETA